MAQCLVVPGVLAPCQARSAQAPWSHPWIPSSATARCGSALVITRWVITVMMIRLGIMSSPNLLLKKKGVGRCLGDFSKGLQPEKTSWEILKTFLGRNIEMLSVGSSILRFSTFWDERTESRIDFVLFAKPWPTGSAVRLDLSWNLFDAQASIAGSAVFWMHGGWYGLL